MVKNTKTEEINLSIKTIESMALPRYINSIIDEQNNLYIITGECLNGNNNQDENNFNRNILKFNSKGILIDNKTFSSNFEFKNTEIEYVKKDNNKYLLITTSSSIELFDIEKGLLLEKKANNIYGYKTSLKKINNENYLYIYQQQESTISTLVIKNIFLNFQNNKNILNETNYIKNNITKDKSIISCDTTNDDTNKYIICAYYNSNNQLEISSFSPNLELISTKLLEEETTTMNTSYFFKIIYFKASSKFILINSLNENITRLRYYKYKNNLFLNQLTFISDDDNDSIDIEDAQLAPLYEYNDIIALNSKQVLKISSYLDDIIISMFSFYNDDTLLEVKNFKFKENKDFSSFINPRLSIFNNIIVVCLSTMHLNQIKTGYFFINYPKATYLDISANNDIKVKNLVLIENNIFGLEPKIKITEIPEGFIFYNSENEEIKNGTYLYINDSLVFKEYKKSLLSSLKYEVISTGSNYDNYYSKKIYPSHSSNKQFERSDFIINGEIGILNININKCDNEFCQLEGKEICTKLEYEGFYLDKKENMYKKCHPNCKTCSGAGDNKYMNCTTCLDGYFITEDTNSCYNELPDYYFLNKYNIYRRCSANCIRCFKRSNTSCLACSENYTFFLSNNSCVFNEDIEDIPLSHTYSRFRWVFITIFFISIMIGIIISFRPIHQFEKYESQYDLLDNENKNINSNLFKMNSINDDNENNENNENNKNNDENIDIIKEN